MALSVSNLGQRTVRFRNDGAQTCGKGVWIDGVERSLIAASTLAAAGHLVRFRAQGGEIVDIKTGRKMPLVRKWLNPRPANWRCNACVFPGLGM